MKIRLKLSVRGLVADLQRGGLADFVERHAREEIDLERVAIDSRTQSDNRSVQGLSGNRHAENEMRHSQEAIRTQVDRPKEQIQKAVSVLPVLLLHGHCAVLSVCIHRIVEFLDTVCG